MFFNLNTEVFLLIAFTFFLVVTDRAFQRKVRFDFHLALLCCFVLTIFNIEFFTKIIEMGGAGSKCIVCTEAFLRTVILCLLIFVTIPYNKILRRIMLIPVACSVFLIMIGFEQYCIIPSSVYAIALYVLLLWRSRLRDKSDIAFATLSLLMFVSTIWAEITYGSFYIGNNYLASITCIYYYYLVMKIYKKDRLTGLAIRHNLNFEMEDNYNRTYDMVLIDVDNFKLINDKYGHDRGDEVLVTIVKATLKHLPKGCIMYRFGGDEFVIISRKVPTETLTAALEDTNKELAEDDLRMSYGIVTHKPGTDSMISLAEADKAMYENKRLIKSEDIWDDMTGLYNLRGFVDELNSFRRALNKEGRMVCLVGVDVERLSNINMSYGYLEGNLIISVLAKVLKSSIRGRDFIGHLGSDEFVVAIECESEEDELITSFINQLQEAIDNSFELSSKEYSVKLNIDNYLIERDDSGSSEEHIDKLLYIKQENKDNRRKSDLTESADEYNEEEAALVKDILDNNRLNYAFQPIVSAKNGEIIAYESLMRSDTDPMVSPLKILKYAEKQGRLSDVEKLTVFNTMAKFANNPNIPANAKIFLNLIPGHFLTDAEYDLFRMQYGALFDRMVVEITELKELDDESLVTLNTRRDKHGFSLAIDDYGSGVSNTNNLLRYMPQTVKIDRLLIAGIDRNAKKQFFVNSIISFAKENDMQTLAEGVETESELRTVIRLGIDMIQGYVVSKPMIDIVEETPADIKKLIVNENIRVGSKSRMAYTANERCELSVVQLAMEDYSRLIVSTNRIKLTGSTEYTADMIIKVTDNTNCHMTMTDVFLNSVDDRPCIELGENTELTIEVQGTNRINSKGIYVPESSKLTIIGSGELQVYVKGHECYAIGTDSETAFGSISLKHSGLISLSIDGEQCVGIGGGIVGSNSEISLMSGTVNLVVAGVQAVGIGAYKGDVNIHIKDSDISSVFRVSNGTVMGTLDGRQNIDIKNFALEMTGSGSELSVIGCPGNNTGNIDLASGSIKYKFSGHIINFIGGETGDVNIGITHCNISILGEGDYITGFGTRNEEAVLHIAECSFELTINASYPMGIGAMEKDIKFIGPNKAYNINGVSGVITDF